jgi:hypothetical protein
MEICSEAITAQYNRLSGVKKYNRADYDKWLGDYDVSPMFTYTRWKEAQLIRVLT